MTDIFDRDYFSDPGIIQAPAPYFQALRKSCPVQHEPYHGSLMVTGYQDIQEVLNRRDGVFSACVGVVGPVPPLPFKPQGDDITEQVEAHRAELPWSDHLVSFDGAKHFTHRALVTRLLTFERIKRNEDYLHGLADRLIDSFIARGSCNLVPEYAHATTVYAISDMMGIPEADRAELLEMIGAPPSSIEGDAGHKLGADPLVFLEERFVGYIRQRQENPGNDLLTELAVSRFKDGSAPDVAELARLARFTFGAAQDTTSRLIAMAVLLLAEDQALQRQLRADRTRIADFLEETLRADGPVKTVYRLALKNTTVGGVDVAAGTVLTLALHAANRDPAVFENPDAFDIDRPKLRDHFAFSRGAHGCPGAPLARTEARIAIDRLLERLVGIRLSVAHHGPPAARSFRFEPTYSFRSLADLHIEFSPA